MLILLEIFGGLLGIAFLAWAAPAVLGVLVMVLALYWLIVPYSPDPPPY